MGFDDLLACPLSPALGPIAGLGPNITSPLMHPATRVSTTAPLTSHTVPSQPTRPNALYQHPRASDQCSCDGESRPTHLPSLDRMNTNVRMPAVQLSPQRIPLPVFFSVLATQGSLLFHSPSVRGSSLHFPHFPTIASSLSSSRTDSVLCNDYAKESAFHL